LSAEGRRWPVLPWAGAKAGPTPAQDNLAYQRALLRDQQALLDDWERACTGAPLPTSPPFNPLRADLRSPVEWRAELRRIEQAIIATIAGIERVSGRVPATRR
jgi:hypothetical protein